ISYNDTTIAANDTVRFKIDLKNIGNAQAMGIKATLTAANSTYIKPGSCSATPRQYPTIGHFEVKQDSISFQFIASSAYPSGYESLLAFKLKVENKYGKVWNYDFDLSKPAKVTGLDEYSADTTEIDLKWNYSTTYSGYNVYRCNADSATGNPVGDYVKVNTDSVTFGYYIDKNLGKLTKYIYKVAGISTSGNEGLLSDTLMAWTSFSCKKFPLDFGAIRGGITAADINNDGYKEIFGATKGGYILGVDHNGKELYNIDGNVTTQGAYATLKTEVWGTPAVGDLHSNGQKQLIGANRNNYPFKAYCFSSNSTNSSIPDTLWTTKIPSGNKNGAILSNIDNSADGSLEVIFPCENGDILTYNANGNPLDTIHSPGSLGAIAVADLTGVGTKEIIKAVGNGIYIWKNDGNPFNGINGAYCSIPSGAFTFNNQSVIVCDIDNDGKKEIIATAVSGATGKIYAIRTDFPNTIVANWNTPAIITDGSISVGDLNHDGILEIAALGSNRLNVLNNKGVLLDSIKVEGLNPVGNPIIADVDGNSGNEIIFGSALGTNQNLFGYSMDFVHNNIKKVLGFPLKTHATTFSIPCVSDINNDGKNELIAGVDNWIYIWKTNGIAGNVEWGCDWQNEYNTGEYTRNCNSVSLESSETWSSNHDFCGDLNVKSGTLTINNGSNLKMGNTSTITINSGASLIIDSGSILNANVRALAGSNVTIKNNGSIKLRTNAEFYTEKGTIVDMQYGSIDK
ncbi:MAG: VCBS repeat-containing protein, partial [Paludibacter sp.]